MLRGVGEEEDADRIVSLAQQNAALDVPEAGVNFGIVDDEELRVLGILAEGDGGDNHAGGEEGGRAVLDLVEDGIID